MATGHYARVEQAPDGRWRLRRGVDPDKDQSYFLFSLTQEQLARAAFPVGALTKTDVRAHARTLGLRVAEKPDSQEICFVPDGDYASFVERQAPASVKAGTVADESGRALATHEGVHRFTIGQRKGLGVSSQVPLYVLRIDADSGQVTVGPRAALERRALTASQVNWTAGDVPSDWRAVTAQIRHRHRPAAGRVRALPDQPRRVRVATSRSRRSRPARPPCSTTATSCVGGGWIRLVARSGRPVDRPARAVCKLPLLLRKCEREQHVAGHAAEARIARVHEQHPAGHDRTGAVERAAGSRHAVDGRVGLRGIDVPQQFPVRRWRTRAGGRPSRPENTTPGIAVTAAGCAGLQPGRGGAHGVPGATQTLAPSSTSSAVSPPPCVGDSGALPMPAAPPMLPACRPTSDTAAYTRWPSLAMPHCTPPLVPPAPTRVCHRMRPPSAGSSP